VKRSKRRGPGPSHLLMTPDHAGNVVGVDPHKRTLTATVEHVRDGLWQLRWCSPAPRPRSGGRVL